MSLYWADNACAIRRNTYTGDKSALQTVFTNYIASVQQNDVGIGLGGGGYSSRTYTIFFDTTNTILPEDRVIDTSGREYRVLGTKLVTSGAQDYQEITAEETQEDG